MKMKGKRMYASQQVDRRGFHSTSLMAQSNPAFSNLKQKLRLYGLDLNKKSM